MGIVSSGGISAAIIGTLGSAAGGMTLEDTSPPPLTPEPAISFTFTPGVWLPRLGGEVSNGGRSITIDEEWDLNDSEATFNGELIVRFEDAIDLRVSGFDFSTSAGGIIDRGAIYGDLTLDVGDAFQSSFDMTSAAAEVRFARWPGPARFAGRSNNRTHDGRLKGDLRFMPTVGVRGMRIEHSFELAGAPRERTSGHWVGLYGGLHFEITYRPDGHLPFIHELRLEGGGAIGGLFGDDTGLLWQVHAGLTCMFTPNVGGMFGYRLVHVDVDHDDFAFDVGLQGLFLAGTIRF